MPQSDTKTNNYWHRTPREHGLRATDAAVGVLLCRRIRTVKNTVNRKRC